MIEGYLPEPSFTVGLLPRVSTLAPVNMFYIS
jgi:hypothetical protein